MQTFLVLLHRSGPEWNSARPMEQQTKWREHAAYMDELVEAGTILLGGPLSDQHRVVLVVQASDSESVAALMGADPWAESHLRVEAVEAWDVRLDHSGVTLRVTDRRRS